MAAARRYDRLQDVKESIQLRSQALEEFSAADAVGQSKVFLVRLKWGWPQEDKMTIDRGQRCCTSQDARTWLRWD